MRGWMEGRIGRLPRSHQVEPGGHQARTRRTDPPPHATSEPCARFRGELNMREGRHNNTQRLVNMQVTLMSRGFDSAPGKEDYS